MVCNILTAKEIQVSDEMDELRVHIPVVAGIPLISLYDETFVGQIALGVAANNNVWIHFDSQKGNSKMGISVMKDGRRAFFIGGEVFFHVFAAGIGINRESEIELRNPVTGPVGVVRALPDGTPHRPVFTVTVPAVIWEVRGSQIWKMEGYQTPGRRE